ncbi:unnamed protein product [Phaedon cochleariae]|uniref:Transporter n=1 Tax=Phaedon cochleariae TaxID=80249 RepID=A0A9P0DI55_PHACE|nr:unnamed protein product [Phaedon cochleariae]
MSGKTKLNGHDNPSYTKDPDDVLENGTTISAPENINKSPEERAQWGNGLEFLMSCIAMSVGLGNIWRFPFIANKNGGGAFLIPYLIILTFVGRPVYYLEMSLGQFSSRGSVKMFEKLSPVFKGIGYGQVLGSTCVASYYCILMAITLFYFLNSFTDDFPWATCQDSWKAYENSRNLTCIDKYSNVTGNNTISSSELYFRREVLKEKDDISDGMGTPDWRLSLLLLFSWAVTFLVSVRGVKSSGKASYFLALFPYVIMITLLVRASTLEGATDGMFYFVETDFSMLLNADVWYAAVTQCFFSLNIGFGSIIMFSSYNRFEHNINRDALVVTTLDTFTSLLSGITIFGILGNLAFEMGVEPKKVISVGGGTGLAFISYPDAISKFTQVSWLFALLFFFMLFVLGVGSLVALHGTLNTTIKEAMPGTPEWMVSGGTAILLFLIGLIYTTPGGQYTLDLVDHFGGTFVIFVCAILEVYTITWFYGVDNFCTDLEFMTKKKVGIYWRISWGLITPVLLTVIFVYFLATLEPLTYGIYKLLYPIGLSIFGWGILGACIVMILGWAMYYFYANRSNSFNKMVVRTFSTKDWGPENPEKAEEWKKYCEDKRAERKMTRHSNWFCRKAQILIKS